MCLLLMPATETKADDGETAIFPAPQVYLKQLAYESYSHGDQNAIDILPGGNVFAPFTGKIAYVDANWGYVTLQSLGKVYWADGTYDYMTAGFMHDSDISDLYVGKTITQGTPFYQAGGQGAVYDNNGNFLYFSPNAYGAHVHITVHRGTVTRGYPYGTGDEFAFNAFYIDESKTSIVEAGHVKSGNSVYNNAPTNYAGLWKKGNPSTDYTVTLNANGGTCSTTSYSYAAGDTLGTIPSPTPPQSGTVGYYFAGWYTQPFGGTEVSSSTPVTSNMTLYAHWAANASHKLAFNLAGGSFSDDKTTYQVNGYDIPRDVGYLVVYRNSYPNTNEYGYEIAVDANGRITGFRNYGSGTKLTMPSGGFILSGQYNYGYTCGGTFVNDIHNNGYQYVSVDYSTGTVAAYKNYTGYLADNKYMNEMEFYHELPVPVRPGYYFRGWKANGTRADYLSGYCGDALSAEWSSDPIPSATVSGGNGHVYDLYNYSMSWTEAKALCEALGGHLVSITSQQEQDLVVQLINSQNFGQSERGIYYIGATDADKEGTWKWVTGETFSYDNWDKGYPEPSGGTAENYCAIMGADNPPYKTLGEWIDNPNSAFGDFYSISNSGFICETESRTYSISYNANGGTGAPDAQTKTHGVALPLSSTEPTRADTSAGSYTVTLDANGGSVSPTSLTASRTTKYTFKYWNTAADGSGTDYDAGAEYTKNETAVLYAQWDSNTTTTAVMLPTPFRNGYTFQGWGTSTSAASGVTGSYTPTGNVTLYAVWKQTGCPGSYSEWSTTKPTGVDENLIETKIQYRYADKETTTGSQSTMSGWTLYDTQQVWSDYGSWSDWTTTAVTASDTVQVETTPLFRYYYFYCPKCGRHEPFQGTCDCGNYSLSSSDWNVCWSPIPYSQCNYKTFSYTPKRYYTTSLGDGQMWIFGAGNLNDTTAGTIGKPDDTAVVIKTGYRSRTRTQSTVYYFYRWTAWSSWGDTVYTASDTRKVETRTMYRYIRADQGQHSWNNGTVTTAADCTHTGITTFTCTVCGVKKTEEIPAKGHTWGEWIVTTPATVTSAGVETRTCSVCGEKENRSYQATTVQITFNANGGSVSPVSETILSGGKLTALPTPSYIGHTFDGWYTSASGGTVVTTNTTFDANTTIYAHWSVITYTISYDANGGTGAPASQTKTHDAALTLSSTKPTRADASAGSYTVTLNANGGSVNPMALTAARTTRYTFKNWNTKKDGSGTSYTAGASYTANAAATLYAQWNSSVTTAEVTLPTPTREGYTFNGWGTSEGATDVVTGSYTPISNVTLYAVWTVNEYTISYDANGGTGAPASQPKTHGVALALSNTKPTRADASAGSYTVTLNANGGSVNPTSLTAARTTNYTFKNWNTKKDGSGTSYNAGASYTANAAATLYAQWTSSVTTAEVTLPTPTRNGYEFLGWGTASTSTSGVTGSYTPTGNVTLYAVWRAVEYTIAYEANGGTGAPESQTKTHDIALTLSTETPTRADASAGSFTVTLDANKGSVNPISLSAARTTKYSFKNWNIKSDGSGTAYNAGAGYTANTSALLYAQWNSTTTTAAITLPTPTRDGYEFLGWGTSATSSSGVTGSYAPDGNVTLYAVWKANEYTIVYEGNGGTGAPANQTKIHDKDLTLSSTKPTRADASAGSCVVTLNANGGSVSTSSLTSARTMSYTFRNWNTAPNGNGTGYAAGAVYSANSEVTLYAQWNSTTTTAAVTLPTPTRDGYTFLGWGTSFDAQDGITGSYTPSGDVTLYALWEQITYYLDLNGYLDGEPVQHIRGYGTADIYINGNPDKSGVSDYAHKWPAGTTYEIRNIQAIDGFIYNGVHSGSLSGTITATTEVSLSFSTAETYVIDYDANDGSGAPAGQTKVQNTDLTLSVTKPDRADSSAGSYTVTLDAHGGSVSVTTLSAARTTSYTFKNWNTKSDGSGTSYNAGASYTANAAATLYAQWNSTENTADVTLPVPTRDGFTFLGWGTSETAASGITGGYTPTGNVTLFAVWEQDEPDTYLVTYDAAGGTGAPEPQIKTQGVDLILSKTKPTRKQETNGYVTVTFNANGGSCEIASKTAKKLRDYSFMFWNTEADYSGTQYAPGATLSEDADVTLYAYWNAANSIEEISLPTASRDGYTFLGWAKSANATAGTTGNYTPAGNVTLYAVWEQNPPAVYTISFNANGGTESPAAQEKTHDVPLSLTQDEPIRADESAEPYSVIINTNGGKLTAIYDPWFTVQRTISYQFAGWNTEADGSGTAYTPGSILTANEDITLYAQWDSVITVQSIELPEAVREGYNFEGWSPNRYDTSGVKGTYTPECSISLYAVWSEAGYTISYDAKEGTGAPGPQTKMNGTPISLSTTVPTRAGVPSGSRTVYLNAQGGSVDPISLSSELTTVYTFQNWNTRINGSGTSYSAGDIYSADANVTLYAQWKSTSVAAPVVLPTPTREGYSFQGWGNSEIATSGITGSYTPISDVTLFATWKPNEYTVVYDANGGSGSPSSQTKIYGTDLTLSSTVPTRSNTTSNGYTVTLNSNGGNVSPTSLTAPLTTEYTFKNWNTAADGSGTNYSAGAKYAKNETAVLYAQWDSNTTTAAVTLPTPFRNGYTFLGWAADAGADSGMTGSYTPDSNVTLYAVWQANGYTVAYDARGGSGAPAEQTKTYGTPLTLSSTTPVRSEISAGHYTVVLDANGGTVDPAALTAARTTSYTFKSWNTEIDGTGASYNAGGKYNVNESVTLYAQWDSNTTTAAVTLPTPVWAGHTFHGWGTTASESNGKTGSYTPIGDVILYAIWETDTYTVRYDANGGTDAPEAQTKIHGEELLLSSSLPTRKDYRPGSGYTISLVDPYSGNTNLTSYLITKYTFSNWNTKADGTGTNYGAGAVYASNAPVTLFAQWDELTAAQTLTLPNRTRNGYTFAGWRTEAGTVISGDYTPTEDIRLTAVWTADTYVISYDANGGTDAPEDQVKVHDVTLTLSSTQPTRADEVVEVFRVTLDANGGNVSPTMLSARYTAQYTFMNWNTKANGTGVSYNPGAPYQAEAPMTLYAQWSEKTLSASVTLPTPSKDGYTFIGWGTDAGASSGVTGEYTPTANITLYAVWEQNAPNTYSVTFDANGGTGAPEPQTKTHGTTLTLSSTTPTKADTIVGSFIISLDANEGSVSPTSLSAIRTAKYTFQNWNTETDGSGAAYNAGSKYSVNESVILYAQWAESTATAAVALPTPTREGYTFKGWGTSSDATSGVSGSYTPESDVTLYAVWEQNAPNTYSVTYDANGGTNAPEAQTKTHGTALTLSSAIPTRADTEGESFTVTLDANGGNVDTASLNAAQTVKYTFKNWNTEADGSGASYNAGGKYSSNESVILYAQWTESTMTAEVTLPIPTRDGYTFKGWGTSANATSGVTGNYTPSDSVTLYAIWEQNATPPQDLFTDVMDPTAYYYDAVYWARDNGITTGRTPTTFDPYAPCTRGQIVTFLWRMMGEPSPASSSNPFTDVKPGDYFYNAVLWAYHRGITTGKTATTFLPYSPCTREQCVTFLWRTAGKPGSGGGNPFKDVKTGTYYYDAVRWAVANGITTGRTATVFGVGQTCTRAQIVTFLYRYAG